MGKLDVAGSDRRDDCGSSVGSDARSTAIPGDLDADLDLTESAGAASRGSSRSTPACTSRTDTAGCESQQGAQAAVQDLNWLPSIGSRGHMAGDCQPCAWFWKPAGCMHGAQCRRCHLCSPGTMKVLRKLKRENNKRSSGGGEGLSGGAIHDEIAATIPAPAYVLPSGSTATPRPALALRSPADIEKQIALLIPGFRPPPGLELPVPQAHTAAPRLNFGTRAASPAFAPAPEPFAAPLSQPQSGRKAVAAAPEAPAAVPAPAADVPPPPAPVNPTGELSLGSALHGTGQCRPCAWRFKPEGCANGKDCLHCHLCSEGALRLRKQQKKRAAAARHADARRCEGATVTQA